MSVSLDLPTIDEPDRSTRGLHRGQPSDHDIEWGFDEGCAKPRRSSAASPRPRPSTSSPRCWLDAGSTRRSRNSRKDRIFGDLSGWSEPLKEDYAIGGPSTLRDWLDKRERASEGRPVADQPSTQGVLLVGVPGCGSHFRPRRLAQAWYSFLYRLDMASVLGMYVGQSESRLREALEILDCRSLCALDRRDREGPGQRHRRLGCEPTTPRAVLVLAGGSRPRRCSSSRMRNDVTSLPPGFYFCKGRFRRDVLVDLPDRQDRGGDHPDVLPKHLSHDIPPDLTEQVVTRTEGLLRERPRCCHPRAWGCSGTHRAPL